MQYRTLGRTGIQVSPYALGALMFVPPGTDVGRLDQAYQPQALTDPSLRRRPQPADVAADGA